MHSNRFGHALACLISTLALTSAASAQRAGQPNPDYLEQKNPKSRILDATVRVQAWDNTRQRGPKQDLEIDRWTIQQAFIVFPIALTSASHVTTKADGAVEFDDRDVDARLKMEAQFPAGANYAIWIVEPPRDETIVAREMELNVTINATSYETIFHEDAARQVEWPQKDFPDIVKSTFENIPYMDYDPAGGPYDKEPIQKLIEQWTSGQDPRSIPPAELAKWLAGNVMQHVQISGEGLAFPQGRRGGGVEGVIEGVQLQPPVITATRRRGSPFDMPLFLCAVYREAGLPARVVVGYGIEDEEEELEGILRGKADKKLRAWVEFALYDERDGTVTWIPVDIVKMRESGGNRMQRGFMERPQKYFGTHDELDGIVPFSYFFFPPTTVRSYSGSNAPGFWGWFISPQVPDRGAFQSIQFDLKSASVGGGNRGN